jgi:hypothetical protein
MSDIVLGAMADEPLAGKMWPLPPVGNATWWPPGHKAASALTTRLWRQFLSDQPELTPGHFGERAWADVLPAGQPPGGAPPSRAARRRLYWTTRFVAHDAATAFAAATTAAGREAMFLQAALLHPRDSPYKLIQQSGPQE